MINKRLPSYQSSNISCKEKDYEPIKVAFYARVSTAHEAQIDALQNQLEWCHKLRGTHPNWEIPDKLLSVNGIYVDEGITGTSAKKRVNFLQAIEDGKRGVYDLLVVRDVSRFARNAEESLRYTHELKKYGVEVFFCSDGIWSKDPDGDLRLGIMSILAQDESRRISEKVLAGQAVSRSQGVLYGTGNSLGLTLVKRNENGLRNTYAIEEEGAETVRMIYDFYVNKELGIKKICSELIKLKRKNASGIIKWSPDKISRILDNRTYSGYIGYNKSVCTNFLDHTRVKMPKSEIEYVKGDFPAIIDDSLWQKAQQIKNKRYQHVQKQIEEGLKANEQRTRIIGKKPARDKWVKKLRCSCGKTYKKYRWRVNQTTDEECFGFQCQNTVRNRRRSFIESQGLSGEGYCDMHSIPQWHLEYMFRRILQNIWKNPERTIVNLLGSIQDNYQEYDAKAAEMENAKLLREEERLKLREKRLMETWLDGLISKEDFASTQAEIKARMDEIRKRIDDITGRNKLIKESTDRENIIAEIGEALLETTSLDTKFIDDDLVDSIVERIVPYEDGTYKWYLNFSIDSNDGIFDETHFAEYESFDIGFEEAKAYRKHFGNFIRLRQWRDIHVIIYIRVAV